MKFYFLLIAVCTQLSLFSQEHYVHFCGQVKAREKLFGDHPGAENAARLATEELEAHTSAFGLERGGDDQVYIIPVVFHVIHNNGPENISDAQIFNAIEILTRDFRKLNADTSSIVSSFQDIAADTRIEFRLASRDPQGNCHPGINRVQSELTNEGYAEEMRLLSTWPRNSYLNIWVCAQIGDNVAGFTNLPGDVNASWLADTDGIVLTHSYIGAIGTGSNLTSRALTHEVGHWLNLYHPWGPTNSPGDPDNCAFDDLVQDTPNTIGYTSCSLNSSSCTAEIDNVQNYMEYSYCSRMFTWGQRQRMRAALTSTVAQRNQLWSNNNLVETGVLDPPLCAAVFTSNKTSTCINEPIQFTDLSYHNATSWNWNFGDGTTLSGNDPLVHKNPVHEYTSPGSYTVSLMVSNGTDDMETIQTGYITINESGQIDAPFAEGFENGFPTNVWSFYNQNNDLTWEVTPTASFSGTKSLKLRNFSNTINDNVDELYSATYDVSGADTIYLSYRWAYANKTVATDDRLRISVSGNCGNSWDIRKLRKGLTNLPTADPTNMQFTPTNQSQWGSETLTLLNDVWMTDKFRVKFEFIGKGGNNIFLDDINITTASTVGVREIKPSFVFNVYPNPSAEDLTLELIQSQSEFVTISVYSSTGQLCQSIQRQVSTGRNTIVLDKQAAGLYTVLLEKNGSIATQKVIFR